MSTEILPMLDFPVEEYRSRIARLDTLMDEVGMDAILVSEYNNYRYFAGYNRPFTPWSGYILTRPFICILRRGQAPVIFVHASNVRSVSQSTWIEDVRGWSSLPFSAEALTNLLKDLGLGQKVTVGLELGEEQLLAFPVAVYEQVAATLNKVRFTDASETLWRLRIRKSSREVDCLRHACSLMSSAYSELFKTLRVGQSERDAYQFIRQFLYSNPSCEGLNFLLPTIFPGGVTSRPPRERFLIRGDLFWLDGGAIFKGYRSDFSRIGIVGEPSPEQLHLYEIIRGITHQLVKMVGPGVPVSTLSKRCDEEMKKAGFPPKTAGRIGHGIGLTTGEPPSIMASDETILAPGMVITLEPGHLTEGGYFVLEEIIAVSESGAEVLTQPSPDRPYVIAGA